MYTNILSADCSSQLNSDVVVNNIHCVKSFQIRSFSGPIFPYSVQMREKTDQKNFVFGQFLPSDRFYLHLV